MYSSGCRDVGFQLDRKCITLSLNGTGSVAMCKLPPGSNSAVHSSGEKMEAEWIKKVILIMNNFCLTYSLTQKIHSTTLGQHMDVNLLKPTGYVMHQQFNIQHLYVLSTPYLCVLYLSENKRRLVPLTV